MPILYPPHASLNCLIRLRSSGDRHVLTGVRKMRNRLDVLWKKASVEALSTALGNRSIRRWALKYSDKKLYDFFVNQTGHSLPQKVQEMRSMASANLLHAMAAAIGEGRISAGARRGMIRVFLGQVLTGEADRMRPFKDKYGFEPPSFLTISPTQKCNLLCKGCYASSSSGGRAALSYDVFRRILQDKKEQWGSHLTIISGGEPLLYRHSGKGLLDIVKEFSYCYFLIYTNGTLIDDATAAQMAELGNISPAISLEGWEQETDRRRGTGVFRKIERAMDHLRKYGVAFGISVTATRENAETILSDKFLDYLFKTKGATYGWIFHYMPIGRSSSLEMMVTPEQRQWMLQKEAELIFQKRMFLIDFWNGGALSAGCISAGRTGGYFYIDWNGDISPCVFFPYAVDNIYAVYDSNRSLSSILSAPLFKSIREWQDNYKKNGNGKRVKNLFAPCPIRDHYAFARDLIDRFKPKPLDEEAARSLRDPDYYAGMVDFGRKTADLLNPIWEEEIYSGKPFPK
jgi:MoaA/NifB/PqqE/SkfB family radical SAM enzyme